MPPPSLSEVTAPFAIWAPVTAPSARSDVWTAFGRMFAEPIDGACASFSAFEAGERLQQPRSHLCLLGRLATDRDAFAAGGAEPPDERVLGIVAARA